MSAETVSRPVAGEPSAPSSQTVSIREADQRAEEIYRQVEATGVPVTVTDQGHPIAQIIPISTSETPYERLLREGEVRPASRSGHGRGRAGERGVPQHTNHTYSRTIVLALVFTRSSVVRR